MDITASEIFKILIYTIGLTSVVGVWIGLGANVSKIRSRLKISRELYSTKYNQKWIKNEWLKKYHFLLSSAIKKYELEHFSKIVSTQAMVFIIFSAVLSLTFKDIFMSVVFSILFIYVIPIGFMYLIHKQKQNALQNELVETSIILLQELEKNNHHMMFALKDTVKQLKGSTQIAYARLFARMYDEDEIKLLATENFAFQLGHFRGRNLANIILRACKDGTVVTTLLEDLIQDLTEFNKRVRNAETESRETAMIGFALLPSLAILYFINDKWLIPGGNTFYYQFQTEQGLKSFLLSLAFGIVGIGMALIVKKPKN